MKYAAYYKRFLSSLIDIIFLYFMWVGAYYLYPQHYEFGFNVTLLFLVSILYHFAFYKYKGRTWGEKYLGLKLVFTREVQSKNFYYLVKAVIMSIVYCPFFSFREGSISFIIGSVILQFYPKIREKKILFWDFISKTAVIDERTSSVSEDKDRSNEESRTSDI